MRLAEHVVLGQIALIVALVAAGSVENRAQWRIEGVDNVLVVTRKVARSRLLMFQSSLPSQLIGSESSIRFTW